MLPALLTVFLWSYCVIAARRSVQQLGENTANLARILVAVMALGLIAHAAGLGLAGGGLPFFLLSGMIGFGFGDIGIFYALPRIGARMTLLLAQCLAAPVAGFAEWLWLGTTLNPTQIAAVVLILIGISVALAPRHLPETSRSSFYAGLAFGVLAALGQGLGAVLSRRAYAAAAELGTWQGDLSIWDSIVMGATTGYQRLLGGTVIIVLFFIASRFIGVWRTAPHPAHANAPLSSKAQYILLTAASGPIFGIICFQWALATTPSAVVQPIVAMTPLAVMPMTWLLEGERPNLRSVLGSCVSVGGVLLLAFA